MVIRYVHHHALTMTALPVKLVGLYCTVTTCVRQADVFGKGEGVFPELEVLVIRSRLWGTKLVLR